MSGPTDHVPTTAPERASIDLRDATLSAERRLKELRLGPLSREATDKLCELVTYFIVDLGKGAARAAGNEGDDVISARHLQKVAEHIAAGTMTTSMFSQHLNTFGGLLLGAALGNSFSWMNVPMANITRASLLLTLGAGIVGAFLIALGLGKRRH